EDRVRAFSLNYWAINLGFAVSSMAAGFIAEFTHRRQHPADLLQRLLRRRHPVPLSRGGHQGPTRRPAPHRPAPHWRLVSRQPARKQ
ncbi:hypothetical protein ACWD4N_45980, partial [Streptomyces sp. NPDC002586]